MALGKVAQRYFGTLAVKMLHLLPQLYHAPKARDLRDEWSGKYKVAFLLMNNLRQYSEDRKNKKKGCSSERLSID